MTEYFSWVLNTLLWIQLLSCSTIQPTTSHGTSWGNYYHEGPGKGDLSKFPPAMWKPCYHCTEPIAAVENSKYHRHVEVTSDSFIYTFLEKEKGMRSMTFSSV